MATAVIGRIRPYYRGEWSASTAYTVMDRVEHDGHLFEAIADGTNHEPVVSGSAYWLAISVNGETPEPVWDGTKLSWEYPDGTTTQEVDLQGPKGDKGDKGDPATPLTSDLTSTATDVGLTALGGNRLYNMISDTRTIVVSNPTASITHAPIGYSVSFNTSATSLLVPAQDIVKFYLSVPEINLSNIAFNATNDAATISFTTPAGVVEGTTLTVQLVAEDEVGNKSRVVSTSVTAVNGKVAAPTITVPTANAQIATNAVGVTITGSAFQTLYVTDTHARSRFSICTDSTAQNVVAQYHSNAPELTHTFLVSELDEITVDDTPLYAFLRYEGTNLGWGELSDPQPFTAHFASVDKPTISAPTANATVVTNDTGLTVTTGAFATTGAQDTQAAFKIKITSDLGGLAVVAEKTVNSAVVTYTMTPQELANLNDGTAYVWAAHVGTELGQSPWSDAVAFTVQKAYVATPSVTSPSANDNVYHLAGITVTSSAFSAVHATDTHTSSDWQICSDAACTTVVAEALASSDLTSHTFSGLTLTDGTTYYLRVRHNGTTFGASEWSTAVAVVDIEKNLELYTWAEIQSIGAAGTGANYFDIGDRKSVLLYGTVGTLSLNDTFYVYIIEFNYRNDNGIYFQGFKTSDGTDIALCDSNYRTGKRDGTKTFNMNHWGSSSQPWCTNYGGWKGCDLRYDILGSTSTAPSGYGSTATTSRVGYDATTSTKTSPVQNTLMAALPSTLRSALALWTIYTDNVGDYSSSSSNPVTSSVDYLPLLGEYEVNRSTSLDANSKEKDYQSRMSYYANGNSTNKYNHSDTSSKIGWWLRSPMRGDNYAFTNIDVTASGRSDYSSGLAPAFRVA